MILQFVNRFGMLNAKWAFDPGKKKKEFKREIRREKQKQITERTRKKKIIIYHHTELGSVSETET